MRYCVLSIVILIYLSSCRESQYKEVEHIRFKEYYELNIAEHNYNDLLLAFLTDSNELILNEKEVLKRLEDSLIYYSKNGEWRLFEEINDDSITTTPQISYFEHEEYIIGCRMHSYFQILVNDYGNVLVEGELLDTNRGLESLLRTKYLDSNLLGIGYIDDKRLDIVPFKEKKRPEFNFSIYVDKIHLRKSLFQLKQWYLNLNGVIINLRRSKAELKFRKKYRELNTLEKYFILNYFPFSLIIERNILPPPPPPPPPSY